MVIKKVRLCAGMGGKKIMALYVVSYYMVEFKGRPFKVYL
jgi:hypothetical protein